MAPRGIHKKKRNHAIGDSFFCCAIFVFFYFWKNLLLKYHNEKFKIGEYDDGEIVYMQLCDFIRYALLPPSVSPIRDVASSTALTDTPPPTDSALSSITSDPMQMDDPLSLRRYNGLSLAYQEDSPLYVFDGSFSDRMHCNSAFDIVDGWRRARRERKEAKRRRIVRRERRRVGNIVGEREDVEDFEYGDDEGEAKRKRNSGRNGGDVECTDRGSGDVGAAVDNVEVDTGLLQAHTAVPDINASISPFSPTHSSKIEGAGNEGPEGGGGGCGGDVQTCETKKIVLVLKQQQDPIHSNSVVRGSESGSDCVSTMYQKTREKLSLPTSNATVELLKDYEIPKYFKDVRISHLCPHFPLTIIVWRFCFLQYRIYFSILALAGHRTAGLSWDQQDPGLEFIL